MNLSDFGNNVHSQFGEDGIIDHIFSTIGPRSRYCVEFGASDGLSSSNVACLWKGGWKALLIEADDGRFEELKSNVGSYENVKIVHKCVTGPILDDLVEGDVDFMTIDIDGNDYWVWKNMTVRPRVLCIEYNFMVPPHLVVYQKESDLQFGASSTALIGLGESKGYDFIGLTHCNLFFVVKEESEPFRHYERDLNVLQPRENFAYLASDYRGRTVAMGEKPPFGINGPFVGKLNGTLSYAVTTHPERIVQAYEEVYGPALHLHEQNWRNIEDTGPHALAEPELIIYMDERKIPVIMITVLYADPDKYAWIEPLAISHGYHYEANGGVVALIRNDVAS